MKISLIVLLFAATQFPALAQYERGAGIESAGSDSIYSISIRKTIFTGECPGERQYPEVGYFVSDLNPPLPGRRVKVVNMARGLSPDNPPYTDRSYGKGRASQSFEIALGSKHRGRYFVVRPGVNLIQYTINQGGNIVDSGTFRYNVRVRESEQVRNKTRKEVTKYDSNGKSYKTYEYRC